MHVKDTREIAYESSSSIFISIKNLWQGNKNSKLQNNLNFKFIVHLTKTVVPEKEFLVHQDED